MPAMIEEIKAKITELNDSVETFKTAQTEEKTAISDNVAKLSREVNELQAKYASGFQVPGYEDEKQKFSFKKAVAASHSKNWDDAGYEKDISDTIAKSVNVDTGASGGFLAPTAEMDEIVALARAGRPILNSVGIRKLSGLGSGEITMNKVTGGNQAYWGGSEEAATESNMALGQLSLRPRYLRAFSTLSRELLKQTSVGVEGLIREEIGYAMSKKLEQAALYGTGLANEPKGVVNYAGIKTIALGTNGALPDWDNMDDLVHELEKVDTLEGSLSYVTSPQIAKVLRQTKILPYSGATSGSYFLQKKSNAGIAEFLGYGFETSTLVPVNLTKGSSSNASYIVFGDWSQMLMASWGGMEFRVSEQAATQFKQNQILIGAFANFDFNLRREDSFAVISDAKIAA